MIENNNTNDLELIPNWFFALNDFWFAVSLLKIALWGELGGRQILYETLRWWKVFISIGGAAPWRARPCLFCENIVVLDDGRGPNHAAVVARSPKPLAELKAVAVKPELPAVHLRRELHTGVVPGCDLQHVVLGIKIL